MHHQGDILMRGSSFENDYLIRTIGPIGKNADSALTELVANAWDAGATVVKILMPSELSSDLTIEDDGVGMTESEFISRWMKLGYNRIQHQGRDVVFPQETVNLKRKAYGQNGLGRHGLLCFANEYEVETWNNGFGTCFKISTQGGENPFVITSSGSFRKEGHGTRLRVKVDRKLPDTDNMRHILSARFLHDPSFQIFVNGLSVNLLELNGYIEDTEIDVNQKIKLRGYAIDSTKTAHTKQRQGAAFWVNGRLVGQVGWNIGQKTIVDGRTSFGRKFIFIFQSDDLSEHVLPDWSGFESSTEMDLVYEKASEYVKSVLKKFNAQRVVETKQEIIRKNKKQIKELSPLGQIEVENFLNTLMELDPTADIEILSPSVTALIALEKTRNGKALLEKLLNLDESEIEALNKILDTWSVGDALIVLEEIDRRISVIEAIKNLCENTTTNELKTLHPLVTQARWLFGPEFESSEYASNLTLTNAIKKLSAFKKSGENFFNPRKRPDLIILKDSTLSAVAIENFDDSELVSIRNILLIELKKGGSTIGRDEVNQAAGYVEDLLHCGDIESGCSISTFVVGYQVDTKLSPKRVIGDKATITATTYERLVRTAEKRLFNLRGRLSERYEKFSPDSIFKQVLGEAEQQELVIDNQ